MFCSNCGAKISDDAKFCEGCGRSTNFPSVQSPSLGEISNTGNTNKPPIKPLWKNPFAVSLIALLIAFYAVFVFICKGDVRGLDEQSFKSFIIVNGGIFAYLWKKRGKNAWIGFFYGIFVLLFVIFMASFSYGMNERKEKQDKIFKSEFITSCIAGNELKRAFCTCVADKSKPDLSVEFIKEKIVPLCIPKP